ncbi:MAG: fatty acid desaturase, partial [Pseudomonadota bacterium]
MSKSIDEMEARANAAARALMGGVAWPTVFLGVACLAIFFSSLIFAAIGAIPLWAAAIGVISTVYAGLAVLHEAVHGSINGVDRSRRWLNDLVAFAIAQILGVAYTAHKQEHLTHHRTTNVKGEDPDLGLVAGGAAGLIKGAFMAVPMHVEFYLKHRWRMAP